MTKPYAILTMEKFGNREFGSVGSSRIRAQWLLNYWKNAEEWHVGRDYEVVIFQKAFWPQYILGDAEAHYTGYQGIKIFDECDPSWLEQDAFRYYGACDAITTSTEALAEYIRKLLPGKIVECVPDRVDLHEHQKKKQNHAEVIQRLAWFGYSHNFHYLEQTFPILNDMKVSLHIYSDTGISPSGNYPSLKINWHRYHYETLHDELITYDAAILPLERGKTDVKGIFKSNNKLLTCYALNLPVISVPEDFEKLKSRDARIKEAAEKKKLVETEYDVKLSVAQYESIIKRIKDGKNRA
jgi:hypothetical protein